uniref:HIG1 domain-containing protein n=1 Tax=Panagrolaimus sp. ES5 TaxID=591445 RepID=A0AC34FMG8_9BILA
MDYYGKKLLGIIGIKKAYMESKKVVEVHDGHVEEPKKRQRYTGIPAIPADIGYNSGKAPGGSRSTGVLTNISSNPAVILGMGLTTLALLGMIRRSVMGDKQGTQKYMRYRIIAQFFTVSALVAGVTIFATTTALTPKNDEKQIIVVAPNTPNSSN